MARKTLNTSEVELLILHELNKRAESAESAPFQRFKNEIGEMIKKGDVGVLHGTISAAFGALGRAKQIDLNDVGRSRFYNINYQGEQRLRLKSSQEALKVVFEKIEAETSTPTVALNAVETELLSVFDKDDPRIKTVMDRLAEKSGVTK